MAKVQNELIKQFRWMNNAVGGVQLIRFFYLNLPETSATRSKKWIFLLEHIRLV